MNIAEQCQLFFDSTQIPIQYYQSEQHVFSLSNGSFLTNPSLMILGNALKSGYSLCYTISPEHFYSGLVRLEGTSNYLLVGPVLVSDCSRMQAQKMLERMHISLEYLVDFVKWVCLIPSYPSHQFTSMLRLLDYHVNRNNTSSAVQNIPFEESNVNLPIFDTKLPFIEHISDLNEAELLHCIETGNSKMLEDFFNQSVFSEKSIPKTTDSTVRSLKNILIFSSGLVSRAAINGGMDYDTSINLVDKYLKLCETLSTTTDIFLLLRQMFLEYAKAVAKLKSLPSESILVTKIAREIHSHIYEKLTPTSIAGSLHMNVSYLCTHFKKETGMTITDYINETKIKESIRFLVLQETSILDISIQFGFSSSNYYHTLFKKYMGMTPQEYRRKFSS